MISVISDGWIQQVTYIIHWKGANQHQCWEKTIEFLQCRSKLFFPDIKHCFWISGVLRFEYCEFSFFRDVSPQPGEVVDERSESQELKGGPMVDNGLSGKVHLRQFHKDRHHSHRSKERKMEERYCGHCKALVPIGLKNFIHGVEGARHLQGSQRLRSCQWTEDISPSRQRLLQNTQRAWKGP